MEKMKLMLKDFLTLIGPAQVIEVIDDNKCTIFSGQEDAVLFKGNAAKIRDQKNLLLRDVKHVQPIHDTSNEQKILLDIWIY